MVAIVDETRQDHIVTIESNDRVGQQKTLIAEQPCVPNRATKLAPIREKILDMNTSAQGIKLEGIHQLFIL